MRWPRLHKHARCRQRARRGLLIATHGLLFVSPAPTSVTRPSRACSLPLSLPFGCICRPQEPARKVHCTPTSPAPPSALYRTPAPGFLQFPLRAPDI